MLELNILSLPKLIFLGTVWMGFDPVSGQDRLEECLLMHFSHKMPESNFIFPCVGLMVSSRLNKILLWQRRDL